jgi:hypothetical protein
MASKSKRKKQEKGKEDDKKKLTSLILNGPQVYAIGALGDWTAYDFRIGFYADVTKGSGKKDEKTYILGTQVILSPRATKELAEWLTKMVDKYEQKNGVIKTTEMLKAEGVE